MFSLFVPAAGSLIPFCGQYVWTCFTGYHTYRRSENFLFVPTNDFVFIIYRCLLNIVCDIFPVSG